MRSQDSGVGSRESGNSELPITNEQLTINNEQSSNEQTAHSPNPPNPPHSPNPLNSTNSINSPILPFFLTLLLLAVYLLSFSGKFHVMDELAVFTAGHSLAAHNRADVNPLIWTNHWTPNPPGVWGVDNHLYTKKAPGISVLVAPLLRPALALPALNTVQVGLLTNSLVTALTAALLLILLADVGFSRRSALLAALAYGLGTVAWVYARMFWESSLLAFFFLLAVWAAHRAAHHPARRHWLWLLLAGAASAVGLTLRFEAAAATVMIGLYLLWELRRGAGGQPDSRAAQLKRAAQTALLFFGPSLVVGLWLIGFNFARFGSLSETGYTRELLFRAPWVGGYGLLFSPGRGLFIYAPMALLLFFGLRPAWRHLPRAFFWLLAALNLFYWLFYGSWFAWGGTWGWGPRFLLPILPLLMLYTAYPLDWAFGDGAAARAPVRWAARTGIVALAALSVAVNLLGVAVDFNEHFLRLARNDNFVFNWSAFPPLGHWQILREGLVDVLWLQPGPTGLQVQWSVLLPPLILLAVAAAGLVFNEQWGTAKKRWGVTGLVTAAALALVLWMMTAAARIPQTGEQAQLDAPLLAALAEQSRPGDSLLVPMPPFGDVQEITTRLLAYLTPPLPLWAWIESEPRAIEPDERARVLAAAQSESRRVWLFERWLTQTDPPTPTAVWLDANAFPLESRWFERSGKLTLYALPAPGESPDPLPLAAVPFQGGISLAEPRLFDPAPVPGDVVRLRLAWQLAPVESLQAEHAPPGVIASVQLLDEAGQTVLAQQDRLLVDLQRIGQSPLLPGQTVVQGYGLRLPTDLPAGTYPLLVSLYRPDTGQRLPRAASPDDFVYLTSVTVTIQN